MFRNKPGWKRNFRFANRQMKDSFQIELNGVRIHFQRLELPGYIAFRASFSSKREPIVVARATDIDNNRFWTSVPQGRQNEAEAIGKLIEEQLSN